MNTILLITVGGSCAPVLRAVADYRPDRVYFICSTGERGSDRSVIGPGHPCGDPRQRRCQTCGSNVYVGNPDGPNMVTQAGLPEGSYELVLLGDPDDLEDCYRTARDLAHSLAGQYPQTRIVADYTGGTKSMSVGLVIAALEAGVELSLVRGERADLVQVLDGSEVASLVAAWELRCRRLLEESDRLFDGYHFASAEAVLEQMLQSYPLSTSLRHEIQHRVTLCRAFDAWDRFDHPQAQRLLRPHHDLFPQQWAFLLRLTGTDRRAGGYEAVYDLLLNAARRAAQGRYDDAVARLYRALELLAQTRLLQAYELDSSDLQLSRLPENLRPAYQARQPEGKIQLGLRADYALLADLGDPLGRLFAEHENDLLGVLERRNYSILAHGSRPIRKQEYTDIHQTVQSFLESAGQSLKLVLKVAQFPQLAGQKES